MKRFEFSLEQLLKVKRRQERQAEIEQQRARGDLQQAQAALGELDDQLGRLSTQMLARVGRTVAADQWAAASVASGQVAELISRAEAEVARKEQAYHAAAGARQRLAADVEALVTLRRQQWELWRQEAQQADQEQLDELGMRRWSANRDEPVGPAGPS